MESALPNAGSSTGYLHSSNNAWLQHQHAHAAALPPTTGAAHYYSSPANPSSTVNTNGAIRKPYSLPFVSSASTAVASSASAPSSLTRRGMLFAGDPASYRAKPNQTLASNATSASASPTSSSSAASSPFPYPQPASQTYYPATDLYYPSSYLAAYPSHYYDMASYANSSAAAAASHAAAYTNANAAAAAAARSGLLNASMYGASNVYSSVDPSTGMPLMNLNMNAIQLQNMHHMNMAAAAAAAAEMQQTPMQAVGGVNVPINAGIPSAQQYSSSSSSKKKGKRGHELMINPAAVDTAYYPGVNYGMNGNGHEMSEDDDGMQQMQFLPGQASHATEHSNMNLSPQSSISSSTSTSMPILSSSLHSGDDESETEKSGRSTKLASVAAPSPSPMSSAAIGSSSASAALPSSSSSFISSASSSSTSDASSSQSVSAFSSVSSSSSPLSSLFSSQFFSSYKSMFYTFDQSFFAAAIDFARLSFELALIIQDQESGEKEEDEKSGAKEEKADSKDSDKKEERESERIEGDKDSNTDKADGEENKSKRVKIENSQPPKSKLPIERFHQWKDTALAEFRKPFIYLERKTGELSTLLAKSSADSSGHGRVYQQLDNLRSFSLWSVLFLVKFIKRIRPKLRAFEDLQDTVLAAILDLEGSAWKAIHAPCMQNESTLLHLMQNAAIKQHHTAKKDKEDKKEKKKKQADAEESDESDDEDEDSVKSEEDLDSTHGAAIEIDRCALCRGSLTYFSFPVTLTGCSHDFHYVCLIRHWALFHSAMSMAAAGAADSASATEHFHCPLGSCRKEAIIEKQDVVYDERRWHAKLATVQAMANNKPSKAFANSAGGDDNAAEEEDDESLSKKHNMHMTDAMTLASITDGHSHSKKSHSDSNPSSASNTPAPRGGSSRRGMALVKVSCHQCKTTKDNASLLFCTAKAEKGKRKRKCRKKYCDACLRRSYQMSVTQFTPEEVKKFICPSCEGRCTCAACQRKSLNVKDNEEVHVTLAAAAAAGGHQNPSKLSAAPMLAWDPTMGRYVTSVPLSAATSAAAAAAGWGMPHAHPHAVSQQYLHSAFLPLHHTSMMSAPPMSYAKPKSEGNEQSDKDSLTSSPSSSRAARVSSPLGKKPME